MKEEQYIKKMESALRELGYGTSYLNFVEIMGNFNGDAMDALFRKVLGLSDYNRDKSIKVLKEMYKK